MTIRVLILPMLLAWSATSLFQVQGEEAAKTQEPAKERTGPRLGKYRILSYGAVGKPPLHLGHFVLEEGGKYRVFLVGDKPGGDGTYEFDAAKQTVVWKDGPYKDVFGGEFTIDREGKTHKIRLKRTTIGTNSTDGE